MNALQQILIQARERGITLRLDGDNLKISGEYTDKFLTWASRRKAELIAELRKPAPIAPPDKTHKRLPHDPPGFYFDQPEPDPRDYVIDDGTNSYLKAFLAWAARRRLLRDKQCSLTQPSR